MAHKRKVERGKSGPDSPRKRSSKQGMTSGLMTESAWKIMQRYATQHMIMQTIGFAHNDWYASQMRKGVARKYEQGKTVEPSVMEAEVREILKGDKVSTDVSALCLTGKVLIDAKGRYVLEKQDGTTVLVRHDGHNINPWALEFAELPDKMEYVRIKTNGSMVMGKHDKEGDNITVPMAVLRWAVLTQCKEGVSAEMLKTTLESARADVVSTISALWEENNKYYSGKEADYEGVFERMSPSVKSIGEMVKKEYDRREGDKGLDLSHRDEITGGKFVAALKDQAVYDLDPVPKILGHIIDYLSR